MTYGWLTRRVYTWCGWRHIAVERPPAYKRFEPGIAIEPPARIAAPLRLLRGPNPTERRARKRRSRLHDLARCA